MWQSFIHEFWISEKLSVYDENLLMVFRKLKPRNDDEEIIILLQQLTGGINKLVPSVFRLLMALFLSFISNYTIVSNILLRSSYEK